VGAKGEKGSFEVIVKQNTWRNGGKQSMLRRTILIDAGCVKKENGGDPREAS